MGANYKDRTGQIFGRLTLKKYMGDSYWLCRCSCGKEKKIKAGNLITGGTKSCGCLQKERSAQYNLRHCHSPFRSYKHPIDIEERLNYLEAQRELEAEIED